MKYGYDDGDDPVDILCAVVLGAVIVLSIMISCLGCTSVKACPECFPEIQTVEVKVPIYSCPEVEEMPPMELPEWPDFPSVGASDEEFKEFYASCAFTVKAREEALKNYIKLLKEYMN